MSFLSLKLPFPCKTCYTFSFQVTIKFHNFQARFIINFAILKFCFSLKSETYEKKGHFLATADAAQTQPSSSWFFFLGPTTMSVWPQGKINLGVQNNFGTSNTRTPDHTLRIQQHYHCTKCMNVVGMHVTIVLDSNNKNKRN